MFHLNVCNRNAERDWERWAQNQQKKREKNAQKFSGSRDIEMER